MCPKGFMCPKASLAPVPCPENLVSSKSPLCIHHSKCYEANENQSDTYITAPDGWKLGATTEITELAGPNSQGRCAEFVRRAIQLAKGEPDEPTGIESAKDFGPWLINEGYSQTGKTYTEAAAGAVAIMAG